MIKPEIVVIHLTQNEFNGLLTCVKVLDPADHDGVQEIVVVRKPEAQPLASRLVN